MARIWREGVLAFLADAPPAVLLQAQSYMQYDKKTRVSDRGRVRMVSTPTRQWAFDAAGNLVFPAGFIERVCGILQVNRVPLESYERRDRQTNVQFDLSKIDVAALRPEQVQMMQAVAEHEGGQLVSPTGSGKSYGMREICAMYPNSRIVLCAPGRDTVGTLHRYMAEKFGNSNVGQVGAGKQHTRRITVSTFDSVLKIDQVHLTDILLVDEGHRAPADKYEKSFMGLTSPVKRFMFTATPEGRGDGADLLMESLFGPILVRIKFYESVVAGSILPVHIIAKDQPYGPSAEIIRSLPVGPRRDRVAIWRNNARNNMIVRDVREIMESIGGDPQVLILVDKTEHALVLRQMLPDFTIVHGTLDSERRERFEKDGLVDKEEKLMTDQDRDKARGAFERGELRRVIATSVFSTGVSADDCSVVAIAGGSGSSINFIQSIGRGTRKSDGKTHATVLMWVDKFGVDDKGNYSSYYSRATGLLRAAKAEGHVITRVPCQA